MNTTTQGKKVIRIPYSPHKAQRIVHLAMKAHRFISLVCGRRWGKTVFLINVLISEAARIPGEYWYIAPTYKQAKRIAWRLLKHYGRATFRTRPNESELYVELINGSIIRVLGAENEDGLRGSGLRGMVLDEFASMQRLLWEYVLRPALADYKGFAIFAGTPKGKNHFYEMFIKDKEFFDSEYRTLDDESVQVNPQYKSFTFKTSDNPYIDSQEIEDARLEMNPESFKQEFEASFENYAGIIYKEFGLNCINNDLPVIDKRRRKYYLGIDTGQYTAVTFYHVDTKGYGEIFDEVFDHNGIVQDIADEVKRKMAYWGLTMADITTVIDSASQVKREWEKAGFTLFDSQKDVDNSINMVRNYFKQGKLKMNRSCRVHRFEHGAYVWDDKVKGKRRPKKENDHSVNSTQYILNAFEYSIKHTEQKTYQQLQRKNIFDPDFEEWEDSLGTTWTPGAQKEFLEQFSDFEKDEHPARDGVVGY